MRRRALIGLTATMATALPLMSMALTSPTVRASSHREAPAISEDPLADNTDVYAFVSPNDANSVTLLANYVPFQQPAGGPNFYRFGDDVTYTIHIDNVGDGKDHINFNYKFTTSTLNPNTFLYNTGKMTVTGSGTTATYANWNRPQKYDLQQVNFTAGVPGTPATIFTGATTPPDNVGPRSVGDAAAYRTLAQAAVASTDTGIRSFAGQRAEAFFADLGGIFDLLGVAQPFGAAGTNYLAGLNVNTIALQVPKTLLKGPNDNVVGIWATASRNATKVILPDGSGARTSSGPLVQVSRLGNPLVNEVVIPLGQKDKFNSSAPANDGGSSNFGPYVTSPETAKLLNLFFNAGAPETNRNDLVAVFLTGIPGVNQPAGPVTAAEELRLNMSKASAHTDPNLDNRVGFLGPDGNGFPNGRRLKDDVVDIELQAVDGVLCQAGGPLDTNCRAGKGSVPATLGDGVNAPATPLLTVFPYIADPYGP